MNNHCDYPGPGAGFLSFFVIGLLVYGLISNDELWPRLQDAVHGTEPGAVTKKEPPKQKAATVEWDELINGNGLNITIPDNTTQETNR